MFKIKKKIHEENFNAFLHSNCLLGLIQFALVEPLQTILVRIACVPTHLVRWWTTRLQE